MSSGTLPKPQMRGLLAKRLRFHIVGAVLVSLGVAASYKVCMCDFYFGIMVPNPLIFKHVFYFHKQFQVF